MYLKTLCLTATFLFIISLIPLSCAQNEDSPYFSSFLLHEHPNGDITYELNMTIPNDLHHYYRVQSHTAFFPSDLQKFVTPTAVQPIADSIWQIYNDTEDFTNGVLMIVHQIVYEESVPPKYPIETLVAGKGDCDLLAFIAASILKAGGLDVVLLYYKEKLHMQIGVALDEPPRDARTNVYSISYQNVSYYVGECTGGNWRQGWRIGECSNEYRNESAQIIPILYTDILPIEPVSVTLRELDPSTLLLNCYPPVIIVNNELTIKGQIIPEIACENVTLRAKSNAGDWITITTVETQLDGSFMYSWFPQYSGILDIQAFWSGNNQYNGATSQHTSIFVIPHYLFIIILLIVLVVITSILVYLAIFSRRHKVQSSSFAESDIH